MYLTCNKHYFGGKRNFASHRREVETEITNRRRRNKTEWRGKKLPSQAELYKYHHKDNKKRFHLEATDVFLSKKISPMK